MTVGGLLLFLITAQHWSKAVIKQANHVTRSQEVGTHLDWDLDLLLFFFFFSWRVRCFLVLCVSVFCAGVALGALRRRSASFFRFSSHGEKENLVTFFFPVILA